MSATTSSEALVLAWALEREMHERPASRQKTVVSALLTLATTAVHLAHGLANDSTRDTFQDYCDVQDQIGLGFEAVEVALTEAIESFEDTAMGVPVPTASTSGSDGNAKLQLSGGTNHLHQAELEPDIMSPEKMIELIAGHVHTRLETTLVDALIHPLTNALTQPLVNALIRPLTVALAEPLANILEPQLLGQLSKPLQASLPDAGVRTPAPLDPVATSSSGFSRCISTSSREDCTKKRRTLLG